jgi:hypothetical protein
MLLRCTGASVALDEHADDVIFRPTPQYWGVPENPTWLDLRIWATQELFLAINARCGKVVRSATMAGITPQCMYKWQKADKFSFNDRMEWAHGEYVERLEADLDRFIEESPHNTQIARMFRLKAECLEKYKEDVQVVANDQARELLDKLTEMARKDREERQRLEAGAAEGDYRELGETDRS